MKTNLFRKAALDRLSSPEQLDLLMQVTTSRGWIALIAIAGVIAAAIVWSAVGEIPTRVSGKGILIKQGGVLDVVSLGTGQVEEMLVESGDIIHKGQVLARVSQPSLKEEINKATARFAELRRQHEETVNFGRKEIELQKAYFAKQSQNLQYSIGIAEEQLRWLDEKITVQKDLLAKGLITRETLLNTKQRLYATRESLERTRNELNQINIQELSLINRKQQEELSGQIMINDAERRLRHLQTDMELNGNVVSPYAGRILEVLADKGSVVTMGIPILRVDLIGEGTDRLEAVVYVPPAEGKKIQPGMEIQIEPSTVKREEYGFILGRVVRVAQFPSTKEGIMKVVKNQQLVKDWSKDGAPFEVYAELLTDPETESGFRWSSSAGPPVEVHTGTICNSSIIVRKQKPISMVLPIFREYTGI